MDFRRAIQHTKQPIIGSTFEEGFLVKVSLSYSSIECYFDLYTYILMEAHFVSILRVAMSLYDCQLCVTLPPRTQSAGHVLTLAVAVVSAFAIW